MLSAATSLLSLLLFLLSRSLSLLLLSSSLLADERTGVDTVWGEEVAERAVVVVVVVVVAEFSNSCCTLKPVEAKEGSVALGLA